MKVLQINNFHYPRGGADRVYLDTMHLLSDAGIDVCSFSTLNEKNTPEFANAFFIPNREYRNTDSFRDTLLALPGYFYNATALKNLERLIQIEKPDVAHLHIFQSRLSSPILKILKKYSIPVVMTVHEYKILCPVYTCLNGKNEICEKCAGGNYFHAIQYACNQNRFLPSLLSAAESWMRDTFYSYTENIDQFIFPSIFIRDKHLEYHPEIKKRVHVVYNFVDISKYVPLSQAGAYDLYFGRLSNEKGLMTLLKTYSNHSLYPLEIIGEGPQKEELEHFLNQKASENTIHLRGYLSGNDLIEKVRNARFVIVPSEWYENNPRSVIEAMALGKPVIGADIGGIPELIQEEVSGYVYTSGNENALLQAVRKATGNNYMQMSIASRERAEKLFNSEEHLQMLLSVYSNAKAR